MSIWQPVLLCPIVASIDAVDCVKFPGWTNQTGMSMLPDRPCQDGTMIYAGKYSERIMKIWQTETVIPIESTMILHTPKVQEMIEDLDIPVLIDYASYESHPLGRTEWVKLYGALFNKETGSRNFFSEQAKIIDLIWKA